MPKAQHGSGGLHHLQSMQDQALLGQDILRETRRYTRRILEVAFGILELYHPVSIDHLPVIQMRIRRGKQNRRIHVNIVQLTPPRMRLGNQAFHSTCMAAQLQERRGIRCTSFRVPLVAEYIDGPARTFHVDQVQGMGRHQGDINFETLALTLDLEVMQQGKTVRQAIPQVGDGGTLSIVYWLAYRDHFGHYLLSPRNKSFKLIPCLGFQAAGLVSEVTRLDGKFTDLNPHILVWPRNGNALYALFIRVRNA